MLSQGWAPCNTWMQRFQSLQGRLRATHIHVAMLRDLWFPTGLQIQPAIECGRSPCPRTSLVIDEKCDWGFSLVLAVLMLSPVYRQSTFALWARHAVPCSASTPPRAQTAAAWWQWHCNSLPVLEPHTPWVCGASTDLCCFGVSLLGQRFSCVGLVLSVCATLRWISSYLFSQRWQKQA